MSLSLLFAQRIHIMKRMVLLFILLHKWFHFVESKNV